MLGEPPPPLPVASFRSIVLPLLPSRTSIPTRSYTPVGDSLQLAGTGEESSDFTWQPPQADTRGQPNTGQTFSSGCSIPADCDDGVFCNGVEDCVSGSCQAGTPINCDDGVGCTVDFCNEGTQLCEHDPDDGACDNGVFCDGAETCNLVLDCQAGSDPCPGQTCDEGGQTCVGAGCDNDGTCESGEDCNTCSNDCFSGSGPRPSRCRAGSRSREK